VEATGGRLLAAEVTAPLGERLQAEWGLLGPRGDKGAGAAGGLVAVIEMAAAAGLPLVPLERRDPARATTRGVGELIVRALDAGCAEIILGLGGSATNDGGAGMAQALGARLLDSVGGDLEPGGAALARLDRITIEGLDPRLARTRVTVACDVSNPLCGPQGASAVFGPQKGATPALVVELDAALARYAAIIQRDLGRAVVETPGAGAAGGMGAGLLAFTTARLVPGARLVMETLGVEEALRGAALIITAEGRLDEQTAYGKVVGAVAHAARAAGARVVTLAGSIALDEAALVALGVDVALPLADGPLTLEESMRAAPRLLTAATVRALRLIRLGASLARMPDGRPR
jgi:glycerate kinase